MKKPDEIKKALDCCFNAARCADCPYYPISCDRELVRDAREYIRQLEADKQQLEGMLTHMNQLRDAAAGRALNMEERVHQLEVDNSQLRNYIRLLQAERDAAVRDLTEMAQDTDESCEYCKMFKTPPCSLECRMKNKGFEWRGVQKEE